MVQDEGVRAGKHGGAGSEEEASRSLLNLDVSDALRAIHRWSSTRVAGEPHEPGCAQTPRTPAFRSIP